MVFGRTGIVLLVLPKRKKLCTLTRQDFRKP
jgi:hypothetical protein